MNRFRCLVLGLLAITACDAGSEGRRRPIDASAATADGTPIDAAAIDATASPPDAGCSSAAHAAWSGTSRIRSEGSGGFDETSAEVVWQLAESSGCVDRYAPSGTARWSWYGGLCSPLIYEPQTYPIAEADGALIIDRTLAPPTYQVEGTTTWTVTVTCTEEVSQVQGGGTWIDASGRIAADHIGGQVHEGNQTRVWSFAPVP